MQGRRMSKGVPGYSVTMATKVRHESERRRRLNRQYGLLPDGPPPSFRIWAISGVAGGVTVGLLSQLFDSGAFSILRFFLLAAIGFVASGPIQYALSLHRWRAGHAVEDEPWSSRDGE
jgi:hypothetical protein